MGQPVPGLDSPSGEEIIPNIKPKLPWHNLKPFPLSFAKTPSNTIVLRGFLNWAWRENPQALLTWRPQMKLLWGITPGDQGKVESLNPHFFTVLQSHHGTEPWQRQGPSGNQLVSDVWVIIPGRTQKTSITFLSNCTQVNSECLQSLISLPS